MTIEITVLWYLTIYIDSVVMKQLDEDKRYLPKSMTALLSGAIAGLIAKTVVAPMDRVKIIFQVSHRLLHKVVYNLCCNKVTNEAYSIRNLPRIFSHIIREEGFTALWRGNSATILRIAPYAGIQFMTYDYLKRWFNRLVTDNYY